MQSWFVLSVSPSVSHCDLNNVFLVSRGRRQQNSDLCPSAFFSGKTTSATPRYPSAAELDAFAKKTANSPLSIKIFPSDVRVPQNKQLSKTVNGLDTTGQRCSPYSHPYSGGYQGLLTVVKASVAVRSVVKTLEGRRTRHAHSQGSVAPYNHPLSNGYALRPRHKSYHTGSCKPPDAAIETVCSSDGMAAGGRRLVPRAELAEVRSLMRQMSRVPHSLAAQLEGGEARASPSLQAVAAVAQSDSDFAPGVPPQSCLAFAGAVLPTQSADKAGDYARWQHKPQLQPQPYQQRAARMYSVSDAGVGQLAYGLHPPDVGVGHERNSSLYRAAVQGEFSVGQSFAPLWDNAVSTPTSDAYASRALAADTCAADVAVHLPHLRPSCHQPLLHPPRLAPTPTYSADQNLCCGPPGPRLCHAAVLSSSLQSLECLISEIHPPCIKERMLGRGYEAMGASQLLEHQQPIHIQLPVYR